MTTVRKGQAPGPMSRAAFHAHFQRSFFDPAFDGERASLSRLEEIAWNAFQEGRKAPRTQKAGPGFADPDYDLSVEWRATRDALRAAEARQKDANTPSRVLLIIGSARNDGTCPGEVSKSFRLANAADEIFRETGLDVDRLDLSLLVSDYGRKIHPCKSCVATAMPLCHWPCSCYPNHALGQADDWMAEIYQRWVAAHGVMIVTPVYWGQVPSALKLMMDRMVCADGGNPDPTSTHGKKPEEAKALELAGWPYPKHLAGRVYGVAAHGDVSGVQAVRDALCDWLDWNGLIDAGTQAQLGRYI
ncbi:MAG TPA: flavodoxin family protein, partial [Micropepsaceae bacterium]|nr:flavodoxin family protein [Micropepsaceae bacterium]